MDATFRPTNDDYSDIDNKMEKNSAYVTIMILLYDSEVTNKNPD